MNDDEFWQVAFSFVPPTSVEKNRGEEEVDDVEFDLTSKRKVYKFRCEKTTARLALAPLPCDGGIMGPVGGDVWHASAVLACLPLDYSSVQTVLEIGSGAVGLSGLCAAMQMRNSEPKTMILTDVRQDGLLAQLESNISFNKEMLQRDYKLPNIKVQELDWRDAGSIQLLPPIDLIIGSELIYSPETAACCSSMLKSLFLENPMLHVVVVQVFDRPGWAEFLSEFEDQETMVLQPLPPEWHVGAKGLLGGREALGTLSQLDYGLCWIKNKSGGAVSIWNEQELFWQVWN